MKKVYTKEQLSEMSDHEINLAVAKKLDNGYADNGRGRVTKIKNVMNELCTCVFNPCDNWNDVMPIAMDYGIALKPISGLAYEVDKTNHVLNTVFNINPMRAICEVFLMMDVK